MIKVYKMPSLPWVVYSEEAEKVFTFKTIHQAIQKAYVLLNLVCEECLGTGEVHCMGGVYPNEPHQGLVETRKCICQSNEE